MRAAQQSVHENTLRLQIWRGGLTLVTVLATGNQTAPIKDNPISGTSLIDSLSRVRHTKVNKRLTVPLCPVVARLWGSFIFKGSLERTEDKGITKRLVGNIEAVRDRPHRQSPMGEPPDTTR